MTRSKFRTLKAVLLTSSLGMGTTSLAHAEEEEPKWYDNISLGAFVDAYGAIRSDRNREGGGYGHEAYVQADGFSLAFAGLDVAYEGEEFGATISFRAGPGVVRFFAGDQGPLGIDNITQAYATWKPGLIEGLTLDLGMFGTIYGAEVAESWMNQNYSRGALYYAFQPFWHTGLRAAYAVNDTLTVTGLVVNGVNTMFEDNKSPSLGLQLGIAPSDAFSLAVGYLGALHPHNGGEAPGPGRPGSGFQNFFDVVANVSVGDFSLVGNFDINLYQPNSGDDMENWWGISVAPGYAFTDWFGAAARVEYLGATTDVLGEEDGTLLTLTGTLDFKPVPNSGAVVLRPEFRYEMASFDDYYFDDKGGPTDAFWSAHLGVVVTSMN